MTEGENYGLVRRRGEHFQKNNWEGGIILFPKIFGGSGLKQYYTFLKTTDPTPPPPSRDVINDRLLGYCLTMNQEIRDQKLASLWVTT